LNLLALSSGAVASYAVPVRQASVLLTASFRFGLATDTLAVQLALPLAGCALDFNQPVSTPCRAHKREDPGVISRVFVLKKNGSFIAAYVWEC
jgi:hypothetical protein